MGRAPVNNLVIPHCSLSHMNMSPVLLWTVLERTRYLQSQKEVNKTTYCMKLKNKSWSRVRLEVFGSNLQPCLTQVKLDGKSYLTSLVFLVFLSLGYFCVLESWWNKDLCCGQVCVFFVLSHNSGAHVPLSCPLITNVHYLHLDKMVWPATNYLGGEYNLMV